MNVTIYEKPTCSTCRNTMKLLESKGITFDAINYIIDPIPESKLKELVKLLGIPAKDLVRTKEPKFKELELSGKELTDNEWIHILAQNPELLQRPIVVKGKKAVLARPAEKVLELFD